MGVHVWRLRLQGLGKESLKLTSTHVDHANRDPTDDRHKNIHWVTAQFNAFSVDKATLQAGSTA